MLLNCDLVVCGEDAVFGLPEVKVGVVVSSGGKLFDLLALLVGRVEGRGGWMMT